MSDDTASPDNMSDEEKRHDELTTAPKASEHDADPRIEVTETANGVKRIDVAETAAVRPGNPEKQGA